MTVDQTMRVTCCGCGQHYHIPPPTREQFARCRRCGEEFTIPASPRDDAGVGRRPRRSPRRLAAANLHTSRGMLLRSRRGRAKTRLKVRWRYVLLTLGGVATVTLAASLLLAPAVNRGEARRREHVERGRVARLTPPSSSADYARLSDLIAAVEPAVVTIKTPRGSGSGFVVDPSGLIVTCRHCVQNVSGARALFADGSELPVVGVRAMEPGVDLAVLQVKAEGELPSLAVAAGAPRKGDPVVAFGSPLGLNNTVSEGSVSAIRTVGEVGEAVHNRRLLRSEGRLELLDRCGVIQFTASTMPGSSGGPVVDFKGNVVGVTSFNLPYRGSSYEFAIAANEVRQVVRHLNDEPTPLWEWNEPVEDLLDEVEVAEE